MNCYGCAQVKLMEIRESCSAGYWNNTRPVSDTMSSAHLSNGRVGVGQLRELARRDLLDLLDKYSGSKALVWDESLTGPLGLIAEYSVLKEHEVRVNSPRKFIVPTHY